MQAPPYHGAPDWGCIVPADVQGIWDYFYTGREGGGRMSLFNVTIYLETTIKGPRPRMAAGAYLVEYITSRNEPETRGKIRKMP